MKITINVTGGLSETLKMMVSNLEDKQGLHAQIAGDAENFLKEYGAKKAANEHTAANKLGAKPTGHLQDAYDGIEGHSDQSGATLLIPRSSRLRAAFGEHVIKPGAGKYYLTIPVDKDSHGKRAGEFGDQLIFARLGRKRTPVLARRPDVKSKGSLVKRSSEGQSEKAKPLEVLYVLTKESKIPEDRSLIPFDLVEQVAIESVEIFLDGEILKRYGTPKDTGK